MGSDNFTSATLSNVWTPLTNARGRLTNANGQLNLSASNATATNPALGILEWAQALPRSNSWLAYLQVVVTNDLPVISSQFASAGVSLFQSNLAGSLVFTNYSDASLVREASVTNRVESGFRLNNAPFTNNTFASNTANFYQRQAGPTNAPSISAALVFSNLGTTNVPINTLAYRSTTNSTLIGTNGLVLVAPGPATAVASPSLILPSTSDWTVTVQVHHDTENFTPGSYVGPSIVKNIPNASPMQMFPNRVTLALAEDEYGLYTVSDAFSASGNFSSEPGWNWLTGEAWLNFSYDASSATLSCAFYDPFSEEWIETDTSFDLNTAPGTLGGAWNFTPGVDSFRLLLTGDTSFPGGNADGADLMYFTDLLVETQPVDQSTGSDGSTVWIGLLYDATTTNLIQQFSAPDGSYSSLVSDSNTQFNLGPWGTNSTSPMRLRVGAEAGQTNLPLGPSHCGILPSSRLRGTWSTTPPTCRADSVSIPITG